ncbi:MAG: T9SS type A sorting domain-containing protein [Bacteroidota bacterium]
MSYIFFLFCYQFYYSQELEWVKYFESTTRSRGNSISYDSQNNIIICGRFMGDVDFDLSDSIEVLYSGSYDDVFIVKLDSLGNFIWAKRTGNYDDDEGSQISIDSQDNIYLTGFLKGDVDLDPGDQDIITNVNSWNNHFPFLQKYDQNGDLVWAKYFDTNCDVLGLSVDVDKSDNVLWAIQAEYLELTIDQVDVTFSSFGYHDIFILKINPNGEYSWCKQVGGVSHERVMSVETDVENNVVVGGFFASSADFDPGPEIFELTDVNYPSAFCLKLDSLGNFMWAKNKDSLFIDFEGDFSEIYDLACDKNGNVFGSANLNNHNVIFKLNKYGTVLWNKHNNNTYMNSGDRYGITIDTMGNLYNVINYLDSFDLDPGINVDMVYDNGLNCNFGADAAVIQSFDSNGNLIWGKSIIGCLGLISDLNVNEKGVILFTGEFYNFDFSSIDGGTTLATNSALSILVGKIKNDIFSNVGLVEQNLNLEGVKIYPNPVINDFVIVLPKEENYGQLKISDLSGKILLESTVSSNELIDLGVISNGIYLLDLKTKNSELKTKFIKL